MNERKVRIKSPKGYLTAWHCIPLYKKPHLFHQKWLVHSNATTPDNQNNSSVYISRITKKQVNENGKR